MLVIPIHLVFPKSDLDSIPEFSQDILKFMGRGKMYAQIQRPYSVKEHMDSQQSLTMWNQSFWELHSTFMHKNPNYHKSGALKQHKFTTYPSAGKKSDTGRQGLLGGCRGESIYLPLPLSRIHSQFLVNVSSCILKASNITSLWPFLLVAAPPDLRLWPPLERSFTVRESGD